MSNPNPPALAPRAPGWFASLAILLLAGYAIFLALNTSTVAGGADSSGYLNSARLLARGNIQADLRVPTEFGPPLALSRAGFTPLGFVSHPKHPHLVPIYPVGLPLHLAAASKLLGWHAGPLLVSLGGAIAALGFCYLVARELGISPTLSAAGAAILGACPVFIFTSIQPLSDTLATAWTLAAIFAALRARRHAGWAAACGAACAVAVLVRPTNLVLLPALVVLLGLDWRRLSLAFLGGLPGAVWLGIYNHALYGSALNSGYGDWRAAFLTAYAPPTLSHFAHWLALLLPAAILVLPFAAVLVRPVSFRPLIALGLWFGTIVAVYACYEVSHEVWWCLRFILPALPALIVGALLGLEAIARHVPPLRRTWFVAGCALLLSVWAIGASAYWTKHLGVLETRRYEQAYAEVTQAARSLLPKGSLVVSHYTSGALYASTDFAVLRWDQVDAAQFTHFATLAQQAGRPVCAVLFEAEEKSALTERCPGNWSRVGTVRNLSLWRLLATP